MTSRLVMQRVVRRGAPAAIAALSLVLALAGCGLGPSSQPANAAPGTTTSGHGAVLAAPTGEALSTSGQPAKNPPQPPRKTTAAPSGVTPTPTTSRQPVEPARGLRSFTVLGSGDVLLHDALWAQAQRDARAGGKSGYDFGPLFASVKPAVSSADLAICHMETPLAPPNGPFSSYPTFSVPPQVVPTLKAIGYDTCSTASNHSLDQGERGVYRTLDTLDASAIRHAGTARSPQEAAKPNIMTVKDIKVAQLSYTFSFNGIARPKGKEWIANALSADAVLRDAHRAKQAGAQVVILSIHWGTEYQHTPNSQQTSLARKFLASPDIDLILGHHAHVVQPLEKIGDKWVAYGMGNEVAWQNFSQDTRDGIMPRFTFTEVKPNVFRVTKVEVLPLYMWLDSRPARVYDVASILASPTASTTLKRSCRASLRRTQTIVGQRGAFAKGAILVGA